MHLDILGALNCKDTPWFPMQFVLTWSQWEREHTSTHIYARTWTHIHTYVFICMYAYQMSPWGLLSLSHEAPTALGNCTYEL